MIRSTYILPFLFLFSLTGAAVVVKARRATVAVASQEAPGRTIAPIGVLQGGPSLTGAQIDAILAGYGSPAAGSGADFYDLGLQYNIDPAYALAFFVEESGAGTDPRWDGMKSDGTTTHDIGNISCAGYPTCYGRWRDYGSWREGIEDWYRLIRVEYIEQRGHTTVDEVIPIYAPAFENDVGGYTNTVSALVAKWRAEYGARGSLSGQARATGQPYMLQGAVGVNVLAALNANGGALQYFTIEPGTTWSFGHSIAPISAMGRLAYVGGVYGGGLCDLSAEYLKVAQQLGLEVHYVQHAGVSTPFPSIWLNEQGDGESGQDLTITNTTGRAVTFRARIDGGAVTIEGGY